VQHQPRRSVAYHRLAWCATQWRAWLGEAGRTGRGFVAGRPCVDPLKCRHGRHEYCDDRRNSEKHDGSTVAIPLIIHREAPLKYKTICGSDGSSRPLRREQRHHSLGLRGPLDASADRRVFDSTICPPIKHHLRGCLDAVVDQDSPASREGR
jgi:hypothetical protein